jgi:hypothetical protein
MPKPIMIGVRLSVQRALSFKGLFLCDLLEEVDARISISIENLAIKPIKTEILIKIFNSL